MSNTVFYSWQSDVDAGVTRNLIQRCLEAAVREIAADTEIDAAVRDLAVDRDTKGVAGAPAIAETILAKIDRASVFVADLTYIAKRQDGGGIPNPNVLIEYGWAAKALGRGAIIAVMNTAFGDPGTVPLPFDLRHLRWPIQFHCPPEASVPDRQLAKTTLTKALSSALRVVLATVPEQADSPAPPAQPHPHDVELIGRVRRQLDPSLRLFLSEHDFGGSYEMVRLDPLHEMNTIWTSAAFEFDDAVVQAAFAKVRQAAAALGALIIERIHYIERNPSWGSPKTRVDHEHGIQPGTADVIKQMNGLATTLSEAIDNLDRVARARIRVASGDHAPPAKPPAPVPAAVDYEAVHEAFHQLAFAHNAGAFPSIVPRPRITVRLVPHQALEGSGLASRAVAAVLREAAPTNGPTATVDSDDWQWWISPEGRRVEGRPNPECDWRLRVAGAGLLEYQSVLAEPVGDGEALVLPARMLEPSVQGHVAQLAACARKLGLEGAAAVLISFEGVERLRLTALGAEGRAIGRPEVTIGPFDLNALSAAATFELGPQMDPFWRLAGWPEGSPFSH